MSAFVRYLSALWSGDRSLARLFWYDMALIGTMLNVVTSMGSLLALAGDWPFWAAMAIFFSPLPYNLFLFFCVWRKTEAAEQNTAFAARTGAAVWLITATLI